MNTNCETDRQHQPRLDDGLHHQIHEREIIFPEKTELEQMQRQNVAMEAVVITTCPYLVAAEKNGTLDTQITVGVPHETVL